MLRSDAKNTPNRKKLQSIKQIYLTEFTFRCRFTIGGFEAVHQADGEVAFGSEFGCFLSHLDDQLGKVFPFVQLK